MMSLRNAFIVSALVLLVPSYARADMPDGPPCEPDASCIVCERDFTDDDEEDAEFNACVADAKADGLERSCSEGASIYDEYWCPEGSSAEPSDGCSASTAPVTQGAAFLVSCAAAAALVTLRRKQRRLERA